MFRIPVTHMLPHDSQLCMNFDPGEWRNREHTSWKTNNLAPNSHHPSFQLPRIYAILYHSPFTKKKFHLIKRCLKIVISPKPPRLPPLLKNTALGVSVSTNTDVHILIRQPSLRAT